MTINFAPEAEEDFAAVIGYLAERNPRAAAEPGQRIFATIDKLAANEFDGAEQIMTTGEVIRSWAIPPVRTTTRASLLNVGKACVLVTAWESPLIWSECRGTARRSTGTRLGK